MIALLDDMDNSRRAHAIEYISYFLLFLSLTTACTSPKYTSENYQDIDLLWAMDDYGERFAKSHGMKFLYLGDVTGTQRSFYCIALLDNRPTTIEQGKKFAIYLLRDFANMMHTDGAVLNCFKFYKKMSPEKPLKLPLKKIGFKITYWDNDMNRFKPPYLAEIIFAEGVCYYYEADPVSQKKRLVFKESYEDALQSSKTS
jgi:hypothetical protein